MSKKILTLFQISAQLQLNSKILSMIEEQIKLLINSRQNDVANNEDDELFKKLNNALSRLDKIELMNGIKPVPRPSSISVPSVSVENASCSPTINIPPVSSSVDCMNKTSHVEQKSNSGKNAPKAKETTVQPKNEISGNIHVGYLDMRVGRIVSVERHPDADSLYVEKVDLGEPNNRTIISGLVKHMPIECLQNRLGVFLCNLKAAKMRGIESQGMLMCASCPVSGRVEVLEVPKDAKVGDRIRVPGFTDVTPEPVLNPKKKVWETVKPDLSVNADGVAVYKGAVWTLENIEGVFRASTLVNVPIQ